MMSYLMQMDIDDSDLQKIRMERAEMNATVEAAAYRYVLAARAAAPEKSGDLKRGIIPSPLPERSSLPGKVVYDAYFDPAQNDTFVKISKKGFRYYYPASQEFGFSRPNPNMKKARKKRYAGKDRTPGKYFMRDSAVQSYDSFFAAVDQMVLDILGGGG